MLNICYCFVSHQPYVIEDINKIKTRMNSLNHQNYIVVYGGSKLDIDDCNLINLDCLDDYCSLPEKINKMFKYVYHNIKFDLVAKFDRSVDILKIYNFYSIDKYAGAVITRYQNYGHHINKCKTNLNWNNKQFFYKSILYATGLNYILSKNSISYIVNDNFLYKNHVYEDLYVGSIMNMNNIKPKTIDNFEQFFFDKSHPKYFNKTYEV